MCPAPEDLLRAALDAEVAHALARHLGQCSRCAEELAALRETVTELREAADESSGSGPCLGAVDIAAFVEGSGAARSRATMDHLVACGRCRAEVAAVGALLSSPAVAREVAALGGRRGLASRVVRWASAGMVAAAAVGAIAFGPQLIRQASSRDVAPTLRERTLTTTAPPQIVGPIRPTIPTDSLRWTSVPRADLYRVTIWDRTGVALWQGEARDTVLALPAAVAERRDGPLLWDVKARTGWGRWVASDLAELEVVNEPRRP